MTDYDNFCAICGADMERSGLQNVSRYALKKRDRAYKAADDLVSSMQRHGRYGC